MQSAVLTTVVADQALVKSYVTGVNSTLILPLYWSHMVAVKVFLS